MIMALLAAGLTGLCAFVAAGDGGTVPGAARSGPAAAVSPEAAAAARAFEGVRHALVRFPGGRAVTAEIADTQERLAYGYMFRPEVREDEGMVFVFGAPGVHPFWMKNTLVPLDMLWMDADFRVLYIEPSAPPCRADPCPTYGTLRKASYVLELRAGTAAREKIEVGDRLRIDFPGGGGGAR